MSYRRWRVLSAGAIAILLTASAGLASNVPFGGETVGERLSDHPTPDEHVPISEIIVRGLSLEPDPRTASTIWAVPPAFDNQGWHPLGIGSANGVTDGHVAAVANIGTDVYVGGYFSHAGGQPANNIARWDGSAWLSLEFDGVIGVNGVVRAMAVYESDLFVGGQFTQAGGEVVNRVARWDGSTWHGLGSDGDIGTNGNVYALKFSGSDLYVGGAFSLAGGQPASNVARWDGSSWHILGDGVTSSAFVSMVLDFAIREDDVFVGGAFTLAGGQPASGVARWDGSSWHSLGPSEANGVNGSVSSLAIVGPAIYVGGTFDEAAGEEANYLARWEGDAWHRVTREPNHWVASLAASETDLLVGGYFTFVGGTAANRVARWDGTAWHSLGTGTANGVGGALDPSVQHLSIGESDVFVGGWFNEAGGQPARSVARWDGLVVTTQPEPAAPDAPLLDGSYPSPFTTSTHIRFALPQAARVRLEVFDLMGRRVDVLLNDEPREAGWQAIEWTPVGLSSGVYIVRMRSGTHSQSHRIMLVR